MLTVLTERGLESVAAGASMNFAGSELFEILSDTDVRFIYHREDSTGEPLILFPTRDGSVLPADLQESRAPALQRALSFVQRSKVVPVALPRGWKQFKRDNLLAFFALPESMHSDLRWIAEVRPLGSTDVVFWALTSSSEKQPLEDFRPAHSEYEAAVRGWREHLLGALQAMSGPSQEGVGVDVVLDDNPPTHTPHSRRTLTDWLPALTACQREFVDAASDRSIRLRGPAGSGKTLTMALKAVKEAQDARATGQALRILFVTHSWSLAGDVDELLESISEQGRLQEINILPLIAVAQETLPEGMLPRDLNLIGEDSLSGKMLQLAQIEEVIEEFRQGDWITFRGACSETFRERIDSIEPDSRRGLAWDCLIEFGCVIGADGIFPGFNAEQRYLKLPRSPWMMSLDIEGDRRAVYALYELYWNALQDRSLLTSDQLLTDFLNYLEGFTWNHRRQQDGYDLIFIDEFHLFNALERQVIRFLSREVKVYPRVFMALDPHQSPWEVFVGSDADASTSPSNREDDELESVKTVDIPTVHRSSPQILNLVKHIHLHLPTLDLGADWDYSISEVESLAKPGPKPSLFLAQSRGDEETAIYDAVRKIYPTAHSGAQLAIAIVEEDAYPRYMRLASDIAKSGKFKVVEITSRDATGALKYQNKGIVVGPAEYLAGLQFDTVLVAGLPDMSANQPNQAMRRRAALSLLYLAITRASREVRLFANHESGGIPEVLLRAREEGVLGVFAV